MAKSCPICVSPERYAIEHAMAETPLKIVAERYGMNDDAINKHRDRHMQVATPMHTQMDVVAVFEEHDQCIKEAQELMDFCKNAEHPDTRGWAMGIREWRGCLDQKARMLGAYDQIDPRLQNSYITKVVKAIAVALEPMPEARDKVLQAIEQIEGRPAEPVEPR
jgi:hypothetical protein